MLRISFTGHRPKELFGVYNMDNDRAKLLVTSLLSTIEMLIVERGADTFYSGGAIGTDQLAFMCVEKLKQKYPHIRNILAVPYADQSIIWEEKLEEAKAKKWMSIVRDLETTLARYNTIKSRADEIIYVDTIPSYQPKNMREQDIGKHSNAKLQMRNIYVVDNSEILVAVYNGSLKGGTFNCVTDARRKQKEIIVLDPNNDFKVAA